MIIFMAMTGAAFADSSSTTPANFGCPKPQTFMGGICVSPSPRSPEHTFGRLLLAIAVVIVAARLVGAAVGRLGQPPVMGEVLAGIMLGPSLLGWGAPGVSKYLFPPDIVPLLGPAADIGLAFFMFMVGLELDTSLIEGRVRRAAVISNASVVLPFALGVLAGVALYPHVGVGELIPGVPPPNELSFVLFIGVAMSITAFPVLSRILVERKMTHHPLGVLALAAAAVDDVTAWSLLAVASAAASSGSWTKPVESVILAAAIAVAILLLGRPFLRRLSGAYDEAGHVPMGWISIVFVAVCVAGYATSEVGVATIFGAFLIGLALPRRSDLSGDIIGRMHDFITIVLLPLFFVITGFKADVRGLDSINLWLLLLGLTAIAILGKFGGASAAARAVGMPRKESLAIGVLMNTRGLTELIVLSIGYNLKVIPAPLFTILVGMALITTFAAAPLLRLVDPSGEFSTSPGDELAQAEEPEPARPAILVAAQDSQNLAPLTQLAELLSRMPPREVIVARVVRATRRATGTLLDERALRDTTGLVQEQRGQLIAEGVSARAVAFVSTRPGEDVVRLSRRENVDLVLVDGRRSLRGSGLPGGDVGSILESSPADVAVLVEREGSITLDADHPIYVPFGAGQHDWGALELGSWLAAATSAPLRLVGVASDDSSDDASRMLADASLLVQSLTGVAAEPVLAPRGSGIVEAGIGAGMLIIGLPDDWRRRGLGRIRAAIVQSASYPPTLFVRRGSRPGALAPRETMTRFTWSSYQGKTIVPPPAGQTV
jgi:Kef-type K+ transport system membrane component KefB